MPGWHTGRLKKPDQQDEAQIHTKNCAVHIFTTSSADMSFVPSDRYDFESSFAILFYSFSRFSKL